MQEKTRLGRILIYQSAGFIAIAVLCWIDEMTNLRSLILGDHPYISDFRESTLEMLFVFAVWFIVAAHSRRLMLRVNHIEGFLRVCSWCRRVGKENRWVQFEEFLARRFDTQATHSICEDCLQKERAALQQQKQRLLPLNDAAPAGSSETSA